MLDLQIIDQFTKPFSRSNTIPMIFDLISDLQFNDLAESDKYTPRQSRGRYMQRCPFLPDLEAKCDSERGNFMENQKRLRHWLGAVAL
ncbi:hypothetical protein ASD74_18385 [Rhizobium sp. Root564]|nr:hypothetical protein ASE62_18560 [Rhizobium sp. Leaf202]KQZ92633.1 hypothetical protein ASD74_18385 [Rhizobium sp. Root564]